MIWQCVKSQYIWHQNQLYWNLAKTKFHNLQCTKSLYQIIFLYQIYDPNVSDKTQV